MYNEILKKNFFIVIGVCIGLYNTKSIRIVLSQTKTMEIVNIVEKKFLMFHRIDSKTSIFLYYSLAKGFRFTRSAPHNWRVAGWTKDLWLLQCAMSAKWQQWYVPLSNPNKHIIVFCCSPFLWTLTLKLIITLFK